MSNPPHPGNQTPYGPGSTQPGAPSSTQPAYTGQPVQSNVPAGNAPYGSAPAGNVAYGSAPVGNAPTGYGSTPPAPKKGIPMWVWIVVPLVLLGLIGGLLLALHPWDNKAKDDPSTTVSSTQPATTAPSSTAPSSAAPSSTQPSSAASSAQPSSASSSASSATPTSTRTPLAKPGSTKSAEQFTTLPELTGYKISVPLSTDMNRLSRSGSYSLPADKYSQLNVQVVKSGNQTKDMARAGYKDIKAFENFACGTNVKYTCFSDIAGEGSLGFTAWNGITPEQLQAAVRELLTKMG